MTSTNDIAMIDEGFYLFATVYCDEGVTEAREYVKRMDLSHDDVKIVSSDGMVCVKAKRRFKFG